MNNIEFLKGYGIRTTLIPYPECDSDNYLINLMIEKPEWIYLQETFKQQGLDEKIFTKIQITEEEELG